MNKSSVLEIEKMMKLLELEYEYEKKQFKESSEVIRTSKKIKQGICWFPLHVGGGTYNSLNQYVADITRIEHLDTEHNFEPGSPVCFFCEQENDNRKIKFLPFTGIVSFVQDNTIKVVLSDPSLLVVLQNTEKLGMQLYFDETTYKLMFDALKRVASAKNGRLQELRDIFHGSKPVSRYKFMPTRFPWLNSSQEKAVNEVLLAKDVHIVHGPPGTGKTTTLVEAVYETLRKENQVLVCAQSNMAVDWISEKLMERGVAVLRIGNPTRVNDKMLSVTYERKFESHPLYSELWAIRRNLREIYDRKVKKDLHQKVARLKEKAVELEIAIHEHLMQEARVIACTLVSSANRVLVNTSFETLFIDEAAQALEPACWIAIQKAKRIILAGDHKQLPPTIKCPEALKNGLDRTLMESIASNKPECVTMLLTQYRMNEHIMRFSCNWFYQGRIESSPLVRNRGILDWDIPLEWIDTSDEEVIDKFHSVELNDSAKTSIFKEMKNEDSSTKINPEEAILTLKIMKAYFEKIGKKRILEEQLDTGLISPYKGQVYFLRRLIKQDSFFKPYKNLISINTVDGFQGQERDIIFISLVRSNDEGNIGFLRDLRRMNVAITRARMKLILVGNRKTLCSSKFYNDLWTYIKSLDFDL